MPVFLSSFVNRLDKKGRVSVPAPFRAALGSDASGIVVFRSLQVEALDGCSIGHLEQLSRSLEQQDLPPDTYELIETTIFGGSVQLPFDSEGRITLPHPMAAAVGIEEDVAFVGRRKTFQLWNPKKLAAHEAAARSAARAKDISLSKIVAQAANKMGGSVMPADAHTPVLAREVVEALAPKDNGIYVDGTFGRGGYARALLASARTRVYGIDRDPDAIEAGQKMAKEFAPRLTLLHGPFGAMDVLLAGEQLRTVDGIALDLGVSSPQIDDPGRGFSFRADGPLDMRMSQSGPSAADAVNRLAERELADIIRQYGEERHARRVATRIAEARLKTPITRTAQLADIVRRAVPRSADGIDPATRTFQALRIYVNDEINELKRGLKAAENLLKPHGRLAVVSFHSLEDRTVKEFLRRRSLSGSSVSRHLPAANDPGPAASFRLLTKKPQIPSAEDIRLNPRARSAKLRVAERTDAPALRENAA